MVSKPLILVSAGFIRLSFWFQLVSTGFNWFQLSILVSTGVQYVLDSTVGSGVLLADGMDLLADVKKELGF